MLYIPNIMCLNYLCIVCNYDNIFIKLHVGKCKQISKHAGDFPLT